MSNPLSELSHDEVSLLELFEKLTEAQRSRIVALVNEHADGRLSLEDYRRKLREVSPASET